MIKLSLIFATVVAIVLTLIFVFKGDPYGYDEPPITTTAAVTTTTTRPPTTTIAPTTTTTTTPVTLPDPDPANLFSYTNFVRTDLITAFAGTTAEVTRQVNWLDSIGVPNNRTYTGVKLKVLLDYCGIDVSTLPPGTQIIAGTSDSLPFTYEYEDLMDDSTMIAWLEDRGSGDIRNVSRFCHPDSTSNGSAGRSAQNVISLTIN